jgi:predicted nucleotidyltransferase
MSIDPRLKRIVAAQPYPLLFATISGAHLYGFPSPDSDFDLRGAHVLPLDAVVGLGVKDETVECEMSVGPDGQKIDQRRQENMVSDPEPSPGLRPPSPAPAGEGHGVGNVIEMDIVSHDVKKFFGLLLKKNGYVLEQLFSPLVVHTTPEHEELKEICRAKKMVLNPDPSPGLRPPSPAPAGEGQSPGTFGNGVVTKHHANHYFGFAETQWKLFMKESPHRVKPLLYVYRVLLTGIHLMRTGVVEANLVTLNESFKLPYVADLVARKLAGPENLAVGHLSPSEVAFHEREYQRLREVLQSAYDASQLPEMPSEETRRALEELLVRVRLKGK